MKLMRAALVGALMTGSTIAGTAHAGTFFVANTGVDSAGTPKANGAAETNYVFSGGAVRVATSANGFPIGPWIGDNSTSAWIGPVSSDLSAPAGLYTYTTTFNLTAAQAANAVRIIGQWATDDPGTDILLNGVSTGITATGFTTFTPFTINSGFQAGANTLSFVVLNGGGPTGLRTELAGVVPEPASWALMIGGFGMVGSTLRRRKVTTRIAFA